VIDGATGSTTTVSDPNANTPNSVAVNTSTNKIYVANTGSFVYSTGTNRGNVTVIDGATNSTTTVTDPNAFAPGGPDSRGFGLAVDTATNSIYVVNQRSSNVTLIDGATNSTTTITDPSAFAPVAVAVDPVSNRIYVANAGCSVTSFFCYNPGSVTVINGATKSATTIIDPKANAPEAVAVDAMTNQIYVLNEFSRNLTVIDGGGIATAHTLAVLLAGTGTGTVTSNPAGIDCGISSCIASFAVGTPVSLSASVASGSQFSGWSGPCNGNGACNLMTNGDQFVNATFNSPGHVQVVVPNVVGQTQAAATAAITNAGLVTGTVMQQSSSTVVSGDVISQGPAAGTDAASGSAIDLVVSTGGSSSGASSTGYGGGGGLDSPALGALLAALMGRLKLRLQKRAMS
jgi:hypothetical protein